MEVARFKDIKLGKAEVLFQSDDNKVESYDILINNIDKQSKTLEIEIIDKDLIGLYWWYNTRYEWRSNRTK